MKRTTIMLPQKLKSRAEKRARKNGLSLGAFIRQSLEQAMTSGSDVWEKDEFLNNRTTFSDPYPRDLSANLDDFLYGDGSDLR
jgi:hypothetical protein